MDVADGVDLRLACIEHVVKSSLAVIAGWATTLDDKWDDLTDDQRRYAIAVIRRRADQLGAQTEKLLAAETSEPVTLEVRSVLEDVAGGTGRVTVEGEVAAKGDPDGLSHVLTLLIENAVKYSPPDSVVELGARTRGDRVEVWVTDQGQGLPEGCDLFAPGAARRGLGGRHRPGSLHRGVDRGEHGGLDRRRGQRGCRLDLRRDAARRVDQPACFSTSAAPAAAASGSR